MTVRRESGDNHALHVFKIGSRSLTISEQLLFAFGDIVGNGAA